MSGKNGVFELDSFSIWKSKSPPSFSPTDENINTNDLKKIKTIHYLHIVSAILFLALLGVYLGLSLGYEPKLNHLIPISFDVGTFTSNNGASFGNTLLISRSYTYRLWIPLIVMLGTLFILELYPLILYYWKTTRKGREGGGEGENKLIEDNFYYDIVAMGTNLHGWIQHVVTTGILFFVAAGVIGVSNIILLIFFSLVALFIGLLCLYTHELLAGGRVLYNSDVVGKEEEDDGINTNVYSIMNWIPLLFGFVLMLIYLGPFITYLVLTNISSLGSGSWFIWTFGIGILGLAFIMNLIPLICYIYLNVVLERKRKPSYEEIKTILYGYTIIKMIWLLLTVTFAIVVATISIFV